jgi:hypothetical protein
MSRSLTTMVVLPISAEGVVDLSAGMGAALLG